MGDPKNVTKICNAIKCNQSTVSHNLQRLEHCGFVSVRSQGKERIYKLNQKTIEPLLKLMHAHMKNYCEKRVAENGKN